MTKINRIFTALALVVLSATTVNAQSGQCGANLFWSFNASTGTLSITGTGDMDNYQWIPGIPWVDYLNDITSIIINIL